MLESAFKRVTLTKIKRLQNYLGLWGYRMFFCSWIIFIPDEREIYMWRFQKYAWRAKGIVTFFLCKSLERHIHYKNNAARASDEFWWYCLLFRNNQNVWDVSLFTRRQELSHPSPHVCLTFKLQMLCHDGHVYLICKRRTSLSAHNFHSVRVL